MKNWMHVFVLIAVAMALGAQDAQEPKNAFSMLKVGQSVSLNDHGSAYSLSFFDDEIPLTHTLIDVGEDFVVVRDIAGVRETLVPVYAVKSIERVRLKTQ